MSRCPLCRGKMKPAGNLYPKNPRTMRRVEVEVLQCEKCGYRRLKR